MTHPSRILPAAISGLILAIGSPAIAQTATPTLDTTTIQAPVATAPARLTSSMRIRNVGRVPEIGLCRGGCDESATARRGTFTMQMACPDGLVITPYGTCVRLP